MLNPLTPVPAIAGHVKTHPQFPVLAIMFLCFQISFLSHLKWKFIAIELPATFLLFGCLYLGILGFKMNSILACWIATDLIYGDRHGLFV